MGKGRFVALMGAFLVVLGAMWGTIYVRGLTPQLGLDLQGGVSNILIPSPGQGEIDEGVLDQTVSIIRQRVDGLGVAEPEIARQGDTILVQLPGLTDREQAEEVIGRTAALQFRRVLEVIPPTDPEYAEVGPECGPWLEGPPPEDDEVVLCERAQAPGAPGQPGADLPTEQWSKLRLGPVELSGGQVTDARPSVDPSGLRWQTDLDLDAEGADRFAALTADLACEPIGSPERRLAIVLDGIVESAPPVSEQVGCGQGITGGQAVITTGGGQDSARALALVLRTGALPIQLEFAASQSVSPTLGRSSLEAGLLAGVIGLVLVAGYMVFLYRGMGLAAVAELAMFGLLVYGAIVLLGEYAGFTLTLAGVAGVIVSIGIAADSSIIYRERYRDEIRAGRTVRSAAEHAFRRAWRTNLTGNTVAFLAAIVLYMVAVGPVRGFAFTLGLSTLIDTALFATFTRALFGLISGTPKLALSPLMGLRADTMAPVLAAGDGLRDDDGASARPAGAARSRS